MEQLKLKAFVLKRKPNLGVCTVTSIDYDKQMVGLYNGAIHTYISFAKDSDYDVQFMRPTGQTDVKSDEIYEHEYVQDKDTIYLVEYNQQNTSFWIMPVKRRSDIATEDNERDDFIIMTLQSGVLGNGYFSRKDHVEKNMFGLQVMKLF